MREPPVRGHQLRSSYELVPVGEDARDPQPGDFILVHRNGIFSHIIGAGEWIRFRNGYWRHAAYVREPDLLIEALWPRVKQTPLVDYRGVDYVLVRTNLDLHDVEQANAFADSCVGQRYDLVDDIGIGLRFLTPGRGAYVALNSTKICSVLVAETQVRAWANYSTDPADISPVELALEYGVPARRKEVSQLPNRARAK